MKSLRKGGMEDISVLKNRIGRAYGTGEIDMSKFKRMSLLAEELEQEIKEIKEDKNEES